MIDAGDVCASLKHIDGFLMTIELLKGGTQSEQLFCHAWRIGATELLLCLNRCLIFKH